MAPHSSSLAWKIPWRTEEPGRLQSMRSQSWTWLSDFPFNFHFSLLCIGEGNGNPLQCSCLESPRDGGAWWAAIYGVTQSWTQLKWLSSSSSSSSSRHFMITKSPTNYLVLFSVTLTSPEISVPIGSQHASTLLTYYFTDLVLLLSAHKNISLLRQGLYLICLLL